MEDIDITKVTLSEVSQLQQVARQTFLEAFSAQNSDDNMKKYVEEAFSVEKLTFELNDKNSQFYFAKDSNNIIGYLKLNFGQSQTDLKDDRALEIERIYVLSDFHGKRVGQLLYEKALEVAGQADAEYLWLGVWEENPKAIRFYKKNGFVEFNKHMFRLGGEEQTDIMMKLQLKRKGNKRVF